MAVPNITTIKSLQTAVEKFGYHIKESKSTNLTVLLATKNDRIPALEDLAKRLGGVYNTENKSGSSIGRVEIKKYYILAKNASGGSGGGAEITALTECMQCYYCSYVFNIAKKNITKTLTKAQLEKAGKYVDADRSLEKILKNGPEDWITTDVYLKTANKVFDEYGSKMSTPVYFHRGSKFMTNIYKAKAACHKIDKASEETQAPGSFSNDKWNPGDIWASTFKPNETPLKESVSNWKTLNDKVYQLALSGELLGISLKKIGKTAKATSKEFNLPKGKSAKSPVYKYKSWSFGQTGEFFDSKDLYVTCDAGTMQFRTFGGEKSWQGEIKGGAAAGGKIGGGNVDFYMSQVLNKDIYQGKGNESSLLTALGQDKNKVAENAYMIYEKVNSKGNPKKPIMTKSDFMKQWKASPKEYTNSKYICLLFIYNFLTANTAKRNELITKIFRYAQSDVDQSSYYIKIS